MESNSPYYQSKAKELVDSLFEKKVFNEKLTRNDMQSVEDLIGFIIESECNMASKGAELILELKRI